jgi:prophage regulatory protein
MALRIMRLNEVKAVTGLSKTTIYRFEKEGRFPSRVSLGERSVGWFEDDVETFLLSLEKLEGNGIHKKNRPTSV